MPANGRITLKKTVPMSRLKLDEFGPARGDPNSPAAQSSSPCRESELGERIQVACRGRQVGCILNVFKVVLGEVALGVPTSLEPDMSHGDGTVRPAIRQRPIEGRERVNRSLQQSVERELIKPSPRSDGSQP